MNYPYLSAQAGDNLRNGILKFPSHLAPPSRALRDGTKDNFSEETERKSVKMSRIFLDHDFGRMLY